METKLNRRNALTGAVAIAALPVMANAATTNADAELFDLFKRWQEGKALEVSFGAEHSEMDRRATAKEPPVPAELLQPLELPGIGFEEPDTKRGWTVERLECLSNANTLPDMVKTKTATGFDLHFTEKPAPEGLRAEARELLVIKNQYDVAFEAAWKEAQAGEERFSEIVSANTDLILAMAETPAHTVQGLLAKCEVANAEGCFKHYCDFGELAQSITDDVQRLAPQFIGRA